ncbi:MAG: BTAD domain-containing putative transcriptional regulator [Dehalococcoidia bacterium]
MMLGAFQFADGGSVLVLPGGSQRLIAFLALRDRTVSRSATAGTLWPEASEAHAHAALRSALSRLEAIPRRAVHVDAVDLKLVSEVNVDIRDARALANRLLVVGGAQAAADTTAAAVMALSTDLLPDWYDDWAMLESEDWRQLRLHALDALANRLTDDGRFADAIGAALAAVRGEPLRETANATLIHVHLAEGNPSEALAAFERYRILLRDELGLDPSPLLRQLMDDLLPRG